MEASQIPDIDEKSCGSVWDIIQLWYRDLKVGDHSGLKNKTISWLCLFHIQPLPETGIITQTSSTLILILQARKLRIRTSADLLVMGSWTSNKQTNKNLGKQTHATGLMQLFDGDRPPETVCTVDFSWETLFLSTCWTLGCDIPIKSYGSNYISI